MSGPESRYKKRFGEEVTVRPLGVGSPRATGPHLGNLSGGKGSRGPVLESGNRPTSPRTQWSSQREETRVPNRDDPEFPWSRGRRWWGRATGLLSDRGERVVTQVLNGWSIGLHRPVSRGSKTFLWDFRSDRSSSRLRSHLWSLPPSGRSVLSVLDQDLGTTGETTSWDLRRDLGGRGEAGDYQSPDGNLDLVTP